MTDVTEPKLSLYRKGERLGETILTSPHEIEIDGVSKKIEITLFAGYKAAAAVFEQFHTDIVDWAQNRMHARMGLVQILHVLQKDTNYDAETIFNAFMRDLKTFETNLADFAAAVLIALGAPEREILAALAEKSDKDKVASKKKEKPTRSRSTSKSM